MTAKQVINKGLAEGLSYKEVVENVVKTCGLSLHQAEVLVDVYKYLLP